MILAYKMYRRANAKWTVNECLRLEREYDLLELSIQDIALLHERSPEAILYKLDNEGIAEYNYAFLNRQTVCNNDEQEEDEEEEEEDQNDDDSEYDNEGSDHDDIDDDDNEYDVYNVKQQIRLITKQLSDLTMFVYNALSPKNKNGKINYNHLAGC